jgi:hypothetical protein
MSLDISEECKNFLRNIEGQLNQIQRSSFVENERIYYSVQVCAGQLQGDSATVGAKLARLRQSAKTAAAATTATTTATTAATAI